MKKVVVIGGGTGNFAVLSGLKKFDIDLCAIVSMADDGGSTGILRDELGVLPPGDVRQCLVALSDSSRLMRSLMNYRFETGGLGGHSFGNLLLSALEKVTGSFDRSVEEAGKILSIKGKVIPVTTNKVSLKMVLNNNQILEGEREIDISKEVDQGFRSIYLEPYPKAHPSAISQIMNADLIVLSPGDLYTSLIPNLLVEGISEALKETKAKKVFIVNLMNKNGHTTNFKASDYLREIKRFIGRDVFDYILISNSQPSPKLVSIYAEEGSQVENDLTADGRAISADVLSTELKEVQNADIQRNLIRHDPAKLAEVLMKIVTDL
ncbi:MAG TPA: gluconeogenesis factor YvcK family protein [Candidatus Nanoarchaeia archaeon]|nr:gluconeogenesis factor YvcK family protein [Candidatus Nanoarchaeia archaeon]